MVVSEGFYKRIASQRALAFQEYMDSLRGALMEFPAFEATEQRRWRESTESRLDKLDKELASYTIGES